MNTPLWTAATAVLVYASVVAHEIAHAVAMRRLGIRVAEVGLGLRIWPRVTLPATPRRPFALSMSPWLVTAFVRAHDEDEVRIRTMAYRDSAWIFGAGIWTNIGFGTTALAVAELVQERWVSAVAFAVLTTLLWSVRRGFAAYVLPVLVLPMTGLFGWVVVDMFRHPSSEFTGNLADVLPSSPSAALTTAAVVSLALGFGNVMPFAPLDGGRIVIEIVRRRFGSRATRIVGTAMQIAGGALFLSELGFIAWLLLG
jgi:membrane-associated protease RseP (regulator of RpoE activity)